MNSTSELSRRSFIKGTVSFTALAAMGAILSACSSGNSASSSNTSTGSGSSSSTSSQSAQTAGNGSGKVLVAYYSATGHTRAIAEAIADETGGTLFEITPQDPYTTDDLDYNDDNSRVSQEYADESLREVPLETVTPEDFDSYDTVFFGYPIWWGIAAWPVNDFASENDFSGKKVVPFCTSSSSSLGSSASNLEALAGTGDWAEGRRFPEQGGQSDARQWAENNVG